MSALLNEEQLKEWSNCKQRKKLESWLRENKIKFTYGNGNKLISTVDAVNHALGVTTVNNEKQDAFFG